MGDPLAGLDPPPGVLIAGYACTSEYGLLRVCLGEAGVGNGERLRWHPPADPPLPPPATPRPPPREPEETPPRPRRDPPETPLPLNGDLEQNRLDERRGIIDVSNARQARNAVYADGSSTNLDREQADIN